MEGVGVAKTLRVGVEDVSADGVTLKVEVFEVSGAELGETIGVDVPQAAIIHKRTVSRRSDLLVLISMPIGHFSQHFERSRPRIPRHEKMIVMVCRYRVDADSYLGQLVRDRSQETHCGQRRMHFQGDAGPDGVVRQIEIARVLLVNDNADPLRLKESTERFERQPLVRFRIDAAKNVRRFMQERLHVTQ